MAYSFGNSGALWINSNNTALNNLNTGSIACWAYINTRGGSDGGNNGRIYYTKNNAGNNGLIDFDFNGTTGGTDLVFFLSSSSGVLGAQRETGSNSLIPEKTWVHVGASWDAQTDSTRIRMYIAGTQPTAYISNSNGSSIGSDNLCNKFVGGVGIFSRCLSGAMECLAIWNTQLEEVDWVKLASSRNKRIPLQIKPKNLVFYCAMDGTPEGVSAGLNVATDVSQTTNNIVMLGTNSATGSLPTGLAGILSY